MGRFDFSLVQAGNVALGVSLISLFAPGLFGRLDPGVAGRRKWLGRASLALAGFFVVLAWTSWASASVALILFMGLLSGYAPLQYADVRASYPAELTGRALSVFTMAMFLGVAAMQWLTGSVAAWASAQGLDVYTVVLCTIATWLALASVAFRVLPQSPLLAQATALLFALVFALVPAPLFARLSSHRSARFLTHRSLQPLTFLPPGPGVSHEFFPPHF